MKPNICSPHVSARNALALLASTWMLGVQLAAAQGTAFTYQGRLTDDYSPANGLYDLRFAIYDAASGGSTVGSPLTNSMTTVTNGLFTVTLDFGASVFTGAERWLEIGVRAYEGGAFTALSPRQPITPTPYAIRAANFSGPVDAGQLTGIISPGHIGAGSIDSTKLAAGAVTTAALANGAVTSSKLADGAVTAAKMFTVSNWFALTIPNPTPEDVDQFGSSVAALGNDRFVIGAEVAGEAYLFGVNGSLLTTFTSPISPSQSSFGSSVAAVGSDRVLIGARTQTTSTTFGAFGAGAAHLYTTNGLLLVTIANPTPASNDEFGAAVAALGSGFVLVGAPNDDTSETNAGIAYLFSTNGSLVTTFVNPTPVVSDSFGISVAAVGSDRVLIGAYHDDTGATNAGVAYLFSTNGTLLNTFTNPLPTSGDEFGFTLAAVGSDRVLIGSPFGDVASVNAGAAYLFHTSGALITTFTNPSPSGNDFFGIAVAAMGGDRVLIGASSGDEGGFNVGSVYVFSTNGTLLNFVSNPTPEQNDKFGQALAAVGSNRILVANVGEDTGARNTGEAYLFTPESFSPGIAAEAVRAGAITSASLAAGAVTTTALADDTVTAAKMNTVAGSFVVTIPNPTAAGGDNFGASVAGVGNDRLLVGAYLDGLGAVAAGAAYLFDTSGALLTTFANPTPAAGENFGVSVAALGTDRVLIGARFGSEGATDAGSAYLFSVSGALLTTFTNPTPAAADHFGEELAALGTDRVLISAYQDDTGAIDAGAAYLFSTNGALLTTFTNPAPALFDNFGSAVAALGTDRVLIGAWKDDVGAPDAGAAYLFSTNGTLLTTFTNPAPASNEFFGISVAAMGSDRVLIGAFRDANNTGAAYLFSTNGALLTTFSNPFPVNDDLFGYSVAALGNDRVLIGAEGRDRGALNAGEAYLFSASGALITTFTNPMPASDDFFGNSVAAVGTDGVLIGAFRDDTSVDNAGAAYFFGTESYTPGLIADGVNAGSITAASFDPTVGVWTRSGNDVFRSSGNVGIGTISPGYPLDVAGPVRITSQGDGAELLHLNTERSWAFRQLGTGAGTALELGIVNSGNPKDFIIRGNAVGINATVPGFTLHVNGTAGKPGGGSWAVASDKRLKKNIRPLAGALDKLLALHGVNFEYLDPEKIHELSGERMGLVAQEVEKVFPDWVETGPDGYKRVTVRGLEALVVEALRELQQKQDAKLAEELQRRDAENAELRARLEKLERRVNQKHGGGQ